MLLLSGGTGFLGAHLLCRLLDDGMTVRAIHRASSSLKEFEQIFHWFFREKNSLEKEQLLTRLQWVEADILDVPALEEAFKDVTHVYHVAALLSFIPSQREQMMRSNIEGTANMVNLSLVHAVQKFCYASSIAALGRSGQDKQMNEDSEWEDSVLNSAYAISKYRAELEVWRAAEEGLNVVIVNPGVILGYGDPKKGSVRMLASAARGVPMYTEGVNGYVDVQDVARAMVALMKSDISHERFVLVGANLSFRELFNIVSRYSGKPAPKMRAPGWLVSLGWILDGIRSGLLRKDPLVTRETARALYNRFFYDSSKIEKQLGFKFTPMEDSIKETLDAWKLAWV